MNTPIGISDSGVGGLSVASKIFEHLPNEEILYFGDTANVPYGEKSPEEITKLVYRIIDFFISKQVKAVIMACNSSSAIVLEEARKHYDIPIIGVIEPAIREALRVTTGKRIGLIANNVTVSSGAHQRHMTRISGNGVRVLPMACPQLVPLVEQGILTGSMAEEALSEYLRPLQAKGIDTLILGCTHYPFMQEAMRKILKNPVSIVDPSDLTAREMKELLAQNDMERSSETPARHTYYVSGDPETFRHTAEILLGRTMDDVIKAEV